MTKPFKPDHLRVLEALIASSPWLTETDVRWMHTQAADPDKGQVFVGIMTTASPDQALRFAGMFKMRGLDDAATERVIRASSMATKATSNGHVPTHDQGRQSFTTPTAVETFTPADIEREVALQVARQGEVEQAVHIVTISAREYCERVPEKVKWVVPGYIALGESTFLEAAPKAGKSTWMALGAHAILTRQNFIGQTTVYYPILWVTEEGESTFRELLKRANLTNREDFHIIESRKYRNLAWPSFIRRIIEATERTGAMVVVLDTLTKLSHVKDENSATEAAEVMSQVQRLTEAGLAVIPIRHERGAGGEVGQSGRGSTQWTGDADNIVLLQRVGGMTPNRRTLKYIGRHDNAPDELTIERDEDGEYRIIGEEEREKSASMDLMGWLVEDAATPMSEVYEAMKPLGHAHATVFRAVKELVRLKRLEEGSEKGPTGHKRNVVKKLLINQSISGYGGMK